ncbi:proteasome family protein isoform X2 [Wolffia australiana]
MSEAQRSVAEFIRRFSDAYILQDGPFLTPLIAVSSCPPSPALFSVANSLSPNQDWGRFLKPFDAQLGEIVNHHLRAIQFFYSGRYADAYSAFEKSANVFLQEFRNWETAWALQPLYTIAYEIRVLAEKADQELASHGKNPEKLKGAGSFLMKVFGALATKGPKRVGALHVTCQLFKIYFKVTYMYYTGRLEVYNENFLAADQKLTYALTHCNPKRTSNIRMIVKYLVPVKLSLGILPKESLLERCNLPEYLNAVQALKRGDIRLLRRALSEHEDRFLKSGVYLVIEKLELQVYQRMMKKIYMLQKLKDPAKAHQVKMEVVVKASRWLEMDMDIDEVECIMAILIYKNLMKGYFAHKSKVVVLSKQDPFPKLNGKPVGD